MSTTDTTSTTTTPNPSPSPSSNCRRYASKVEDLMAMGYTEEQSKKALKVAGGDLEQAVGYLLLGEESQRAFDYSFRELITANETTSNDNSNDNRNDNLNDSVDTFISSLLQQENGPLNSNLNTLAEGQSSTTPAATIQPGAFSVDSRYEKEQQLMNMGYSFQQVQEALRITHNDLEQAAHFLLLGDSKKSGFIWSGPSNSQRIDHDAAVAAAMQEHEDHSNQFNRQRQYQQQQQQQENTDSTAFAMASVLTENDRTFEETRPTAASNLLPPPPPPPPPTPSTGPKPKIVATNTFLEILGATPFCTCYAASKFFQGGVVSGPFLNNIMEDGIELYRKADRSGNDYSRFTIDNVIKKYGRSHLKIVFMPDNNNNIRSPLHGTFLKDDLQNEDGIRKLLATCRNEQQTGWQILLIELDEDLQQQSNNDSFCICLPPKGTANKFWFIDFLPRSNVRTPGSYTLVHHSLLQMEESIESVFHNILQQQHDVNHLPFTLYKIKLL